MYVCSGQERKNSFLPLLFYYSIPIFFVTPVYLYHLANVSGCSVTGGLEDTSLWSCKQSTPRQSVGSWTMGHGIFAFLIDEMCGKAYIWQIRGFMRIGWKFELKHMGLDLDTPMTPSNRPWRITGLVKIWTESCFLWQVEEIGLSCVCSLPWETIFGQCTCSCDVASFSPVEVAMGLLVGHAFFYETYVRWFLHIWSSGLLMCFCFIF